MCVWCTADVCENCTVHWGGGGVGENLAVYALGASSEKTFVSHGGVNIGRIGLCGGSYARKRSSFLRRFLEFRGEREAIRECGDVGKKKCEERGPYEEKIIFLEQQNVVKGVFELAA